MPWPPVSGLGASLHELLVAEAAKHRILVAQVIIHARVAAVVVDDLVGGRDVVVETAGACRQRINAGKVKTHLVRREGQITLG